MTGAPDGPSGADGSGGANGSVGGDGHVGAAPDGRQARGGDAGFAPAGSLLAQLAAELRAHAPFAQMAPADVEAFVAASRQTYHGPGETVIAPADGPAPWLYYVRRGAAGPRGTSTGTEGDAGERALHHEAGDLFPLAAVAGGRPVTMAYEAEGDLFCLAVEAGFARDLARRSAPLADFMLRRTQQLLALSQAALRSEQAALALEAQSLESPLARCVRGTPVGVAPGTPLIDALRLMHERRVGSVLVLDADGAARGILTRHDVLERVVLARADEQAPIERVATAPVLTLPVDATAQQAALVMSRHGIRHLPLTESGPGGTGGARVVGMVSERDLFALQRLSLKNVGARLRAADDREALIAAAAAIRDFARHLLAQGLPARALTDMISHLNDLAAERAVQLVVRERGLDLDRAAWLAFGSEGRSEQTIATDQDNGLVLADDASDDERAAWLEAGGAVNRLLDAAGYPLCPGNIMAGNPACCLRAAAWRERFEQWMERGTPEDLLAASIFFDLRPIAGNLALAGPLREFIAERAMALPRFRKLLADNALQRRPAVNWRGALETVDEHEHAWLDLKLAGSAVFVDAARLFALAAGVRATGTRERLIAAGPSIGLPAEEAAAHADAFDVIQMLRLRLQVRPAEDAAAASPANANRIDVAALSAVDRRLLKDALRHARTLQQRVSMDYGG